MKRTLIYFLSILSFSFYCSCKKYNIPDEDYEYTEGRVSFEQKPYYNNDTLTFSVKVQLTTEDGSTKVKYKISESSETLITANSTAVFESDWLYITDEINYYLPLSKYKGKTITVTVDPYNEFYDEENLSVLREENWKTYSIIIP